MSRTVDKLKLVCLTLLLNGCMPDSTHLTDPTHDPYEAMNRKTFAFNRAIDTVLLKPLAQSYRTITPKWVNKCISNVFLNLREVNTIANDLLQFQFLFSIEDSWRLVLNTSLGLGGCFDVAENFDLQRRGQSFSNTFKTWGLNGGAFVVLPFLGATTTVNVWGLPIERYWLDPVRWLQHERMAVRIVRIIDKRAQLLPLDAALEQAFDPYIFYKNAYLQSHTIKHQRLTQHPKHQTDIISQGHDYEHHLNRTQDAR